MENKQPQAVILSMTRDGEKLCAAGGRISTQPGDAIEIWNHSQDAEKNSRLIQKVTRSGHNSVVEHACFHLAFQNVSVMVEQFMIEFRLASFTVKSRRYVDFSSAGYYMPEGLDEALTQTYATHMEALFADYQYLIEHDVPKEDARFVLPYCFCSNFYCAVPAELSSPSAVPSHTVELSEASSVAAGGVAMSGLSAFVSLSTIAAAPVIVKTSLPTASIT